MPRGRAPWSSCTLPDPSPGPGAACLVHRLVLTSTPSWALSQTHLFLNAAQLQLEVGWVLCTGHPAEIPPETPS